MATEQGLYAQVIMLRQKYSKFVAADRNKKEAKFKFQGKYARSQSWFNLEFYWIEVNFSTREPDLYKKLSQIHDYTQDINTFKRFQVTIVNLNFVESFKFHNDAPIVKYFHNSLNSCCFSSLVSAFASINHNKDANAIPLSIE